MFPNITHVQNYVKDKLQITTIKCQSTNIEIPVLKKIIRSSAYIYQLSRFFQSSEKEQYISDEDKNKLIIMINNYIGKKHIRGKYLNNFNKWLPFKASLLSEHIPKLNLEFQDLPALTFQYNCYIPTNDTFGIRIIDILNKMNSFLMYLTYEDISNDDNIEEIQDEDFSDNEDIPDNEDIILDEIQEKNELNQVLIYLIDYINDCCKNPESIDSYKNYWGFVINIIIPLIQYIPKYNKLTYLVF